MVKHTNGLNQFDDSLLGQVVTIQEVVWMWQKSKTAIMHHIYTNKIRGRKAVTGGVWLLSFASVVELWGPPITNDVWEQYGGENGR